MKPNDKAIEAAATSLFGNYMGGEKKWIGDALTAAYAAQFKSEDYAGLVERLRHGPIVSKDKQTEAADALDAVLAERDALKAELIDYKDAAASESDFANEQTEKYRKLKAERDALAARLAPVVEEELVEIGARAICLVNCAFVEWRCKDDGVCKAPVVNFRDPNYVRPVSPGSSWQQSRAVIAAIRPHIEAAERERCAHGGDKRKVDAGDYVAHLCEDIAAAIRSRGSE